MTKVWGGPFILEERCVCMKCREWMPTGTPALFGIYGLEHAVHALGGMLPDDIPQFSEWLSTHGATA